MVRAPAISSGAWLILRMARTPPLVTGSSQALGLEKASPSAVNDQRASQNVKSGEAMFTFLTEDDHQRADEHPSARNASAQPRLPRKFISTLPWDVWRLMHGRPNLAEHRSVCNGSI